MIDMSNKRRNTSGTLADLLGRQANTLKHSIECNTYAFGELPFLSLNELQLHENELATATTLNITFRHLLDNDLYLNNLFTEKVSSAYKGNGYFSVVDVSNPRDLSLADISMLSSSTDLVVGTSGTDAELFCLQPRNEAFHYDSYANSVDDDEDYNFIQFYRNRRMVKLNNSMVYLYVPISETETVVRRLDEVGNMGGVGAAVSFPMSTLNDAPPKGEAAIITDLCENQFYGRCILSQLELDSVWALVNKCKYFIATANKGLFGVLEDGTMHKVEFLNSQGIDHYVICEFHTLNEEPTLFMVTKQNSGTKLFYVSVSDYPPLFNGNAIREVEGINCDGVNNSPLKAVWDVCDYGENPMVLPETGGMYGFEKYKYGFPSNTRYFVAGGNRPWRMQTWNRAALDSPFTISPNNKNGWCRLQLNTLSLPILCDVSKRSSFRNLDNQGWYWTKSTNGFEGFRFIGSEKESYRWNFLGNSEYSDLKGCTVDDIIAASNDLLMVKGKKDPNTLFAFVPAGISYKRRDSDPWYKVIPAENSSGSVGVDLQTLLEENFVTSLTDEDSRDLLTKYFAITASNVESKVKNLEPDFNKFVKDMNAAAQPPVDNTVSVNYSRNSSASISLKSVMDFTKFKICQIRKLLSGKYDSEISRTIDSLNPNSMYSPPANLASEAATSFNEKIHASLDAFSENHADITSFMTISPSVKLTAKDMLIGQTAGAAIKPVKTQIAAQVADAANLMFSNMGSVSNLGVDWKSLLVYLKESTKYTPYSKYAEGQLSMALGEIDNPPARPSMSQELDKVYSSFDNLLNVSTIGSISKVSMEVNSNEHYVSIDLSDSSKVTLSSWTPSPLKKSLTESGTALSNVGTLVYAHASQDCSVDGINFTSSESGNISFDISPSKSTGLGDEGQSGSLATLLDSGWTWPWVDDEDESEKYDDGDDDDDESSGSPAPNAKEMKVREGNDDGEGEREIHLTLNNLEPETQYIVQVASHNGKFTQGDVPHWRDCTLASCWRTMNGYSAAWRMMCMLSPCFNEERFSSYLNWMIAQNANTAHLFLCNFRDYSSYEINVIGRSMVGYTPWGVEPIGDDHEVQTRKAEDWWGSYEGAPVQDVDVNVANEMMNRLYRIRRRGLAVVLWLCADDSSAWNAVFARNAKNIIAKLAEYKYTGSNASLQGKGFFDLASIVVAGLEMEEYWQPDEAQFVIDGIRAAVPHMKIGVHQACDDTGTDDGRYNPSYDPEAKGPSGRLSYAGMGDIVFFQVSPGANAKQIAAETKLAIALTGKPVNFFELDRTLNPKLCQAALDAGAFAVGNCGPGVKVKQPTFEQYEGISICEQATRPLNDCNERFAAYKYGTLLTGRFTTPGRKIEQQDDEGQQQFVSQDLTLKFSGTWNPTINAIQVRKVVTPNSIYATPNYAERVDNAGIFDRASLSITPTSNSFSCKVVSQEGVSLTLNIHRDVYLGNFDSTYCKDYIKYLDNFFIKKYLFKDKSVSSSAPVSYSIYLTGPETYNAQADVSLTPTDDSDSVKYLENLLKQSVLSSLYTTYKDKQMNLLKRNYSMTEATSDTGNDKYRMSGTINISQIWKCDQYEGGENNNSTKTSLTTLYPKVSIKFTVEFQSNITSWCKYGVVNGASGVAVTIQSAMVTAAERDSKMPTSIPRVLVNSTDALNKLKANANFINYIKKLCGFDVQVNAINFLDLLKVSGLDTTGSKPSTIGKGAKVYVFSVTEDISSVFTSVKDDSIDKFLTDVGSLSTNYAFYNPYDDFSNISTDDEDIVTWSDRHVEINAILESLNQHVSDNVLPESVQVDTDVKAAVTTSNWVTYSFSNSYNALISRLRDRAYDMVSIPMATTAEKCFPKDAVLTKLIQANIGSGSATVNAYANFHKDVMARFLELVNQPLSKNGIRYSFTKGSIPEVMYNVKGATTFDKMFGVIDGRRILTYDHLKIKESIYAKLKDSSVHTFDVDPDWADEDFQVGVKVLPAPLHHFQLGCTSGSSIFYWLTVGNNMYAMGQGVHAYVDEPGFHGFLDVIDFGVSGTRRVVAAAYSPHIGTLFTMAEGSMDIYAFDVSTLKLKNDLVYDLNVSLSTVYKTALSGCNTDKMRPGTLYLVDRDETNYAPIGSEGWDDKFHLVATFLDWKGEVGFVQRFAFTKKMENGVYSQLALTNNLADGDIQNAYRQFSTTAISSIAKTDEGMAMTVGKRLLRFENGYSHLGEMTLFNTFPKIVHTNDSIYTDYVLDSDLVLRCITIPTNMEALYPYSSIDLKKWFPDLSNEDNKYELIVYDIDMKSWTTDLGVSYIVVYTNRGVFMIDMGRVPHEMKYGRKEAIINYFKNRVLDQLNAHNAEKHHSKSILSRFYDTRRFLGENTIYDFVWLTTNTKYTSPTERHGGHGSNSNVSAVVDKQVFFGGSICSTAEQNPGVVFAAVNSPTIKYDTSWYKAQVSSPIVDTQFYDYFYKKEVSPAGLEIIKNVLNLNHLPFIYRHNTDNTWDMWVNIPSTMTPYMNRIVGSTMNSRGGKLKVENNYTLARKNLSDKFIAADPKDQATTVRLFINPNHFHINSITDVVVNGSSLPMSIYRDDACNDGLFDGVQLQTVWNKVVKVITDKHGVSYAMIEFKVWGSDEQSVHLSGGIATKAEEA